MRERSDYTNQRFGRLLVIARAPDHIQPSGQVKQRWSCRCDCGSMRIVNISDLRTGHTTSCGCFMRETSRKIRTKHGQSVVGKQSTNYKIWFSIKQRCCNPDNKRYKDYGGRGITMHKEWADDFMKFDKYLNDTLGSKPDGLTLDRINNELGYVPGNLRWATYKQQANNRRPWHRKENV